jgi:hypothetical protein
LPCHGRAYPLPLGCCLTAGRGTYQDVSLQWVSINKHHFRIRHDSEGIWVEDLQTINGTRVNGQFLIADRAYPLRPGDRLQPPEALLSLIEANPAWLTWESGTIPRLAQTLSDRQDFAGLPILADALEEAGCTSPEILDHCRKPGEHESACWVLDLLAWETSPAKARMFDLSLWDMEEARDRLNRAGWSIGDTGAENTWVVTGSNRTYSVSATGSTQEGAWRGACEQARGLGLLAPPRVGIT